GVSPDCILSGTTPLFIASSHDQPEIVSALLAVKANPNMGYEDGLSPLIIASENGCIEVVRLLLEHGAEAADACEDGSFPLLVAIECENSSIISLLMSSSCSEDYTQEEADMINDALKKIRND